MAKLGTAEVPEFEMTSLVNDGSDDGHSVVATGLPSDGSLVLARLINGNLEFANGTARLIQYTGETIQGSDVNSIELTSNVNAHAPEGWRWISRK